MQSASNPMIRNQERGKVGTQSMEEIRVDRPPPHHVPEHLKVDLFWAMGSAANDLVDAYEPFAWDANGLRD